MSTRTRRSRKSTGSAASRRSCFSRTATSRRRRWGRCQSPSSPHFLTATSKVSILHAKGGRRRSEEHTSELQSQSNLVCRLLLEKKKKILHKGRPHSLWPIACHPSYYARFPGSSP